jgi:putative endonuclease
VAAHHIHTGQTGEAMAAGYLLQQGFTLLHRNWTYAHCEIDIIAVKNDILHFVEVKTRRSLLFGHPEESVSEKKLESLAKAAEAFLEQYPVWKRVQYDILAITLLKNKPAEFFLIEDVYL